MSENPPSWNLSVSPDGERLAEEAARRIRQAAEEAIRQRGRFTLALAGGSTPEKSYRLLADPKRGAGLDWGKTFLFFGDERFVPHDDPRSNYHMVQRSLLAPAKVPPERVFAIPTDTDSPAASASLYAETLQQQFEVAPGGSGRWWLCAYLSPRALLDADSVDGQARLLADWVVKQFRTLSWPAPPT